MATYIVDNDGGGGGGGRHSLYDVHSLKNIQHKGGYVCSGTDLSCSGIWLCTAAHCIVMVDKVSHTTCI